MILAPKFYWPLLVPLLAWVVMVCVLLILAFASLLPTNVDAAPLAAEPQATATVIPCPEWRKAGAQIIYKCVDDEPPYAICYAPVSGVMQCLTE